MSLYKGWLHSWEFPDTVPDSHDRIPRHEVKYPPDQELSKDPGAQPMGAICRDPTTTLFSKLQLTIPDDLFAMTCA